MLSKLSPLRFIILLLVMTFSTNAYAQYGFEFENKRRKKVFVPFEVYNNLIIVPVRLNDHLPLKFIMDTGIRTTILTEKVMSDVLNLTLHRRIMLKGPGEQQIIAAHVANNVKIGLPGVIGKGQALLVLEEDFLQLRNHLGIDVHGIIGYELFSRFVVEIDYKNRMMILHDSKHFKPKKNFTELPITIEDTKPYLLSTIVLNDGNKVISKLMIDTGASHALLLEEDHSKNIFLPENNVEASIGRGLGGTIMGRLARIESINIGEYDLKNVIASFPSPGSYVDTVFFSRHGTMGGELLSRFNVIFDYSNESIYLKKNVDFKKDFEYDMSGVEVMAVGDKLQTFEVTKVNKRSPAYKSGLMSGDIILDINGMKAEQLKLNQLFRVFHSKPGKRIRMSVERNGKIHKITFKLERII